ncbi:MAG TPA: lipopolysaccharide biosynthesis protein [Stenomitos sp.]
MIIALYKKIINIWNISFSNKFIRNLGWFGVAQLVVRVSRLLATVVLARSLTQYDYGLAAIVLTIYEFINVFTTTGISTKIVQADDEEVESLCTTAYWLNWIIYPSLFVLQCVLAFPISKIYHDERLIVPICLLSLNYLFGPIGNIQASLIERENRLKIIAIGSALQLSVGNILSALFAYFGFGIWAIILPKILSFPIYNLVNLTNHPWRNRNKFRIDGWQKLLRFGLNIMGLSLLNTFRNNLDYLIVGKLLGVKELGLYYFAFNAGLGISQTIINAISSSLYPHLCALKNEYSKFKESFYKTLKIIALLIVSFVIFQTSLAHFYVPIIFGAKWVPAIPILILICLSAIPRPFFDSATSLLIAVGKPNLSLGWDLIFTVLFGLLILVGTYWNITGVAVAVLVSYFAFTPIYLWWSTRKVFFSHR